MVALLSALSPSRDSHGPSDGAVLSNMFLNVDTPTCYD